MIALKLNTRAAKRTFVGLLIGLAAFAPFTTVDNRLDRWIHPSGAERAQYQDFESSFGSDEFLLLAYEGRPLFEESSLDLQREVLRAVEALPRVQRVTGIPTVSRELFGDEDPEGLEADMRATPFYKNLILSETGDTAALLIEVTPSAEVRDNQALVRAVEAASTPLRDAGFQVYLAGSPLLNAVLDERSSREAARTFPVALGVSLLVLWLLFRSLRAMLLAALCGGATVAATCGLMVVVHCPMNMVTAALPALLWVLCLAGSIHVLHEYLCACRDGLNATAAARRSLAVTAQATIIAALTTAAGFLSLGTASMVPVRELGVFAAIGMTIALGVTLLLLPALLPWWTPRSTAGHTKTELPASLMTRWPVWVARYYMGVLAVAVLISGLCSLAFPRLNVSSDPLSFLSRDSKIVRDYTAIADKLAGYYTLEVVIDLGKEWTDPECWPSLESIQARLESQPGVARVLSPLDMLKKLNHWQQEMDPSAYRLPEGKAEAQELLSEMGSFGEETLKRLVAPSGQKVRLSVLVNVMDSTPFLGIVEAARKAIADLPAPVHGYCTGIVLQLVDNQLALVRSQINSFASACLVIFGCIGLVLRSWRMMLVSVLPNVLPLGAVFVAMAVWGLPLDPATVMVASVALGIAVDDTAHVLSRYTGLRRGGMPGDEALAAVLPKIGWPMLATTLTACSGFLALLLSGFLPIAWFGALSAIAMLSALVAEIFLTPALLVAVEKWWPLER